jgi:hypothetical protein
LSKIDLGNGLGRWNTMPTRRRRLVTSTCAHVLVVQQNLAFHARVADGLVDAVQVRRKVDLPQPEGPISAVILLAGTSSEISCRA